MNTGLRLVLVLLLCTGLAGCALGVFGIPLLIIYGGGTATGLAVGGSIAVYQDAEISRCLDLNRDGIAVTEPVEIAIPTGEGVVQIFEWVTWQPEFEVRGYAKRERATDSSAAEGKFAVTERSVLLVPPPGTAGVRIPYEVVDGVELSPVNPHSMTVKSCWNRFDSFDFRQRPANGFDPEAAAAAAARIKARVAALHATAGKQAPLPN